MRERILKILNEINDTVDYEREMRIIDDGLLDSFQIISFISDLSDEFDIEITPVWLVPDNFNSLDKLVNMVSKILEDE